jgi:RNA polymerase sigma factor (sigma-70 family)
MVWCACRRALGNEADAEDAFQATFLVLARKGTSLARQDLLAGWLHGVACRTALAARCARARRRGKEREADEIRRQKTMSTRTSSENSPWTDLRPVLDIELSKLPKKYRMAVVLCDLEGMSRREAARQLRLAEGTLSSRLARGRCLLARRLSRYAPAMAGGALASLLAADAAGPIPGSVMGSAIKSACAFAAGSPAAATLISAPIAALTEGVLRMMFLSKVKMTVGLLLAAAIACTGAGLFASGMLGGQADPAPASVAAGGKAKPRENGANFAQIDKEKATTAGRDEGELAETQLEAKLKQELAALKADFPTLGRQKVKAAKDTLTSVWERLSAYHKPSASLSSMITQFIDYSNALLTAELEISTKRSDRLAAAERHWLLAKKVEIIAERNWKAGRLDPVDYHPLKYHRIDAEIKLLKIREGK